MLVRSQKIEKSTLLYFGECHEESRKDFAERKDHTEAKQVSFMPFLCLRIVFLGKTHRHVMQVIDCISDLC